jgi:hypothetical protein
MDLQPIVGRAVWTGVSSLVGGPSPAALPTIPAPGLSFEGISAADDLAAFGTVPLPPDATGDVGPRHYVQFVNGLARVWDKSGNPLTAPFKMSSLFSTGLCATHDDGHP